MVYSSTIGAEVAGMKSFLGSAVAVGFLKASGEAGVNLVNAPTLAAAKGVEVLVQEAPGASPQGVACAEAAVLRVSCGAETHTITGKRKGFHSERNWYNDLIYSSSIGWPHSLLPRMQLLLPLGSVSSGAPLLHAIDGSVWSSGIALRQTQLFFSALEAAQPLADIAAELIKAQVGRVTDQKINSLE